MHIYYVNGHFCHKDISFVSVEDRGFNFSDGVYEVMYFSGTNVINFQKHLKRLNKSLENLKIKMIHLNDSKGELGCHLDRHEHIGLGHIGETGLSQVVKLANKNKIPIILETAIDERRTDFENIRKANSLA